LVLDPFCGCGTTIFEANELGRKWIRIDITTLAISIMKTALREMKVYTPRDYQIIGEPTTFSEAQALAKADKYQFQWWSLSLINAHLIGVPEGSKVGKKGADRGKTAILLSGKETTLMSERLSSKRRAERTWTLAT
jgi:site-specific DNA-methyltransferase (adenine-specific)